VVFYDDNSLFLSNFTLRASRRLSYAVLPRVRSKKNYDFTLGRLAYEGLRRVQDLKVGEITVQMKFYISIAVFLRLHKKPLCLCGLCEREKIIS
jgi:hypothetical protein